MKQPRDTLSEAFDIWLVGLCVNAILSTDYELTIGKARLRQGYVNLEELFVLINCVAQLSRSAMPFVACARSDDEK